ncbi:hypothetical protein K2X33_08755 [bacterium]|nr:hypothetical protein [bacterium]
MFLSKMFTVLTLAFSVAAVAAPAKGPLRGFRAAFSDFGTGASGAPQRTALELIAKGITDRSVGFYIVEQNGHHGESTVCVEGNALPGGFRGADALYSELEKLKPAAGQQYSLTLTKVDSCED